MNYKTMSSSEYLGWGIIGYLSLLWYWNKSKNPVLDINHDTIENNTKPQPVIRTPMGGNSTWYGYFKGIWPSHTPTNHDLDL